LKQNFDTLFGLLKEFPFCSIPFLKLLLPRMAGDSNIISDPQPMVTGAQGDGVEVIDPAVVAMDVMDVRFAADVHLV
jgi:hypothetical protein